jgi:hypothetical protein
MKVTEIQVNHTDFHRKYRARRKLDMTSFEKLSEAHILPSTKKINMQNHLPNPASILREMGSTPDWQRPVIGSPFSKRSRSKAWPIGDICY